MTRYTTIKAVWRVYLLLGIWPELDDLGRFGPVVELSMLLKATRRGATNRVFLLMVGVTEAQTTEVCSRFSRPIWLEFLNRYRIADKPLQQAVHDAENGLADVDLGGGLVWRLAMTRKTKARGELKGKARVRSEIVEAMRGLHKIGAVGDAELEKTTLRMLGRDALLKVDDLSPSEIVEVRERVGVSQAVLAGFLNVAVNTVSQWNAASANRPARL